jgi:hypothetical protein
VRETVMAVESAQIESWKWGRCQLARIALLFLLPLFYPRGTARRTAGVTALGDRNRSTEGLDDKDVAGRKFGAVGASHHMVAAVGALDPLVTPTGARSIAFYLH